MSDININPVKPNGMVKTAEECFLEAYHKVNGDEVDESADILSLAAASLGERKYSIEPSESIKTSAARIYENGATAPTVLMKALNEAYPEWKEWEPETIWQTLQRDTGQDLSEVVKNKIMAVKCLLNDDTFFTDWHIFEKCILALNGIIPNFTVHEQPSPGQLAYGVQEALKIDAGEFDHEIKVYVRAVLDDNGYLIAPKQLKFSEFDADVEDDVVEKMKADWRKIKAESLDMSESMEGVQLARLASVAKYIEDKTRIGLGLEVR